MSGFDDLIGGYEPPTVDDVVIPSHPRLVGKGAGAGAAPVTPAVVEGGAGGSPGAASTAPEPEPQLPEGSDADEPVEEAEVEAEPVTEVIVTETVAAPEDDLAGIEDETEEDDSLDGQAPLRELIPIERTKLSFDGENVHLRAFPRELINRMRELLEEQLGEKFARKISQPSIVTAFVMSAMGVDMELDADTAAATAAFRANDPRVDQMARDSAKILEQQSVIEQGMSKMFKLLQGVETTTQVLEIGQAYALAERTALLDTSGILPENIEVTQKRVIAARDNIRRKAIAHLKDEKITRGRPIR